MALAEPVLAAAHAYCVAVDERAPKLLEGLYLSGSIALGDFCPGQSDLDFVAVTNRKLDAAITTVLERLHVDLSSIGGRPQLDGLYVTREDLKRDPRTIEPGLRVNGARLCISRDHRDPITWTTLARYGIPFHGPAVSTLEVWDDRDAVVRWCLANLQDYWRRWRNRSARLASPAGLVSLSAWAAAWGVLGISRIHHTVAQGGIISKTAAADYALATFAERWWRIIREAKRIRTATGARSLDRTPFSRRRDLLEFMTAVVEEPTTASQG
jgi:hypothetical protein